MFAMSDEEASLNQLLQAQHAELLFRLDKLESSLQRQMPSEGGLRRGGSLMSLGQDSHRTIQKGKSSTFDNLEIPVAKDLGKDVPKKVEDPAASAKPKMPKRTSTASRYQLAKEQGSRVEYMKQQLYADEVDGDPRWLAAVCRPIRRRAGAIATSLPFNVFFAVVIVSNSFFLGLQLEWIAKHDQQVMPGFLAAHVGYAVLFTLEMSIRIAAVGPLAYFCGPSWAWNWLDVMVVAPAWIELALDLSPSTEASGTEGGASSNFRIIRIFKITRLLQVVRSVRLVRFIGALRALVMSVVDTTRQVVWALLLLGLVIYSFSILFTDAALDYGWRHQGTEESEAMLRHFGTVYISCRTLFRAILGGLDWELACDSLIPAGEFWVQLFHSYIAFCGFAVLNVMTGVFVNSAIKTRERDHETLLQNKQKFRELVSKIWSRMDATGLGQITIHEFEKMFEDEEMKAFFNTIEIDAVDAWTLFDSLDVDGDHTISLDEFSERCMQLHGAARSVDLYALIKQIHLLEEQQHHMSECLANFLDRSRGVSHASTLHGEGENAGGVSPRSPRSPRTPTTSFQLGVDRRPLPEEANTHGFAV